MGVQPFDSAAQPFDSAEFRRVLGNYPTGVTVVTAACDDGPAGLAIGSFTSVSLEPPLVSFCPGNESTSWERMRLRDSFCVNVLGDDQAEVCSVFADSLADRFHGVATRTEATGAPVIEGCLAWIDCRTYAVHPAGDHEIVVGEVVALGVSQASGSGPGAGAADPADASARGPLVFYQGGFGRFEPL